MRGSVTHIIHNGTVSRSPVLWFQLDITSAAWRVDFNLMLMSFEDNICGLKCLIDFALSSHQALTPRLVFISSIGVLRRRFQTSPHTLALTRSQQTPQMKVMFPNLRLSTLALQWEQGTLNRNG